MTETEKVHHILLDHMRALRADNQGIKDVLQDMKHRLTNIEGTLIGLRRDIGLQQEDLYHQRAGLERLRERMDRVERRLDLRDEGEGETP